MKGRQFAEAVSDVVDQLTKFNGDEFSQLARDAHKVVMAAESGGELRRVYSKSDRRLQSPHQRNLRRSRR